MGKISNTVLTTRDQGLTSGQQKNARDNIGAMGRLSTWTDGDVVVSGENGEVVDSGVQLSAKADKTYVTAELEKKAGKTYVNIELGKKADRSYVDEELAKKADKSYVDTELDKKPSRTYVDEELGKKADKTYVDAQMATKVDKVSGKGLSTNDYTDADRQKLVGIGNFPAESGGVQDTLVTTGDKYAWDNKWDKLTEYYLAGATVESYGESSMLVITRSDGAEITFVGGGGGGGSSLFDTISAAGSRLTPVNRNVDIPLAISNTPGQEGSAGLIQGIYEEFQT